MYNFIHRHGIPMFIRAYLGRHIGDESATREVEEYLHKTNHNKYGLLRFVETLTEMQGVLPKAWVNLILIKLLRSLLKTLTNEDLLKILDAYCNLAIQTIPNDKQKKIILRIHTTSAVIPSTIASTLIHNRDATNMQLIKLLSHGIHFEGKTFALTTWYILDECIDQHDITRKELVELWRVSVAIQGTCPMLSKLIQKKVPNFLHTRGI